MKSLCLVVADQLFEKHPALDLETDFLMVESKSLMSKYNYHKFKLAYILTTLREYKNFLESKNRTVFYNYLENQPGQDFLEIIKNLKDKYGYQKLVICEIANKYFQTFLQAICQKLELDLEILASPMFLTTKTEFKEYLKTKTNKLLMNDFYIYQRKRLNILVENQKPIQGKWSFDQENRKKIPKTQNIPPRLNSFYSRHYNQVCQIINQFFPNNPGKIPENCWLPINHSQSKEYLDYFIENYLENFGIYEDAMTTRSDTVFHSCLSTLLNNGLLTPQKVIADILQTPAPINSIEGIIRQIIGWREWIKGLYDNLYDENFLNLNYFKASNNLPEYFYKPSQVFQDSLPENIDNFQINNSNDSYLNKNFENKSTTQNQLDSNLPLKFVLNKVEKIAYAHHIERLMILANWMTLNEYKPNQCYTWFLEMFVDSAEWVMVPNVMGMGLYADGGIFATKPYVSGGNYIKKMSDFPLDKNSDWEKIWTDKFWDFLLKHSQTFEKNPRMAMLIKTRKNKTNNGE